MKLQQIKELIEMVEKSGVAELNITENGEAIHIERPARASTPAPTLAESAAHTTENTQAGDHVVRSPMVGTFYHAATPGAAPFVEVGDVIESGEVVGMISALQINNPIRAPKRGFIRAMLVEDAQPVEYDQPLLVIGRHQETH